MHYGLQISASGALTAMYRMDVLSNNLANMSTAGFKPDIPMTRHRAAATEEDGLMEPSNRMLERLGAGPHLSPNRVSVTQGSLTATTSPLDLAVQGEGFFVVRDTGGGGGERLVLTRDGRFTTDARGRLVTSEGGHAVVSVTGEAITLRAGSSVEVRGDGTVIQGGGEVGRIRLASVKEPSGLRRVGRGFFEAPAEVVNGRSAATGTIRQSHVEESTVDPVQMMMRIASAGREVESNIGMITYSDRMLERAISTLGRTA